MDIPVVIAKTSGFLIDRDSHYASEASYEDVITRQEFGADLVHLMESLNSVESFFDMPLTTWYTTPDGRMGHPVDNAEHPHLMCLIGGDPQKIDNLIGETRKLCEKTWIAAQQQSPQAELLRSSVKWLRVYLQEIRYSRIQEAESIHVSALIEEIEAALGQTETAKEGE